MSIIRNFYLTKEQMSKLSTKRLLDYKRKRLVVCYSCARRWQILAAEDENFNKCDNVEFHEALNNIKEILATREHVER